MFSYHARQPILNRHKQTVAYELLFRNGANNSFPNVDPDEATEQLLIDNFFNARDEKERTRSFINFPYNSLLRKTPFLFSNKSFVIEILEDCPPSDELFDAVVELKKAGYTLALDDFIPKPEWLRFLPYIDIIKFDLQAIPIEKARIFINYHVNKYPNIRYLAEKVENHDEFISAKEAGFEYFQGFFFSKPQLVSKKKLASSQLTSMRLLTEICKPQVDFTAVEKLIATDVSLSYKLLNYVNNLYIRGNAKPIASFKQALIYLGEEKLRRFIAFVIASHVGHHKPTSLYILSVQRAHFCEQVYLDNFPDHNPNQAFLTGLFSLLDSILDQPMEILISVLPLEDSIKTALTEHRGRLGVTLRLIKGYEKANWREVNQLSQLLRIEESSIATHYQESVKYANTFTHTNLND